MTDLDPKSREVQDETARYFAIIRKFWGTFHSDDIQAAAYTGLGTLYINDERYTSIEGKPNGILQNS